MQMHVGGFFTLKEEPGTASHDGNLHYLLGDTANVATHAKRQLYLAKLAHDTWV